MPDKTVKAIDKLAYALNDTPLTEIDPGALLNDITLGKIVLNGGGLHTSIGGAVLSGTVARTTTGASTITLVMQDQDGTLRNLPGFMAEGEITIGDYALTYVAGSASGPQFTATFEASIVHQLMKIKTPKKAERGSLTRARFIAGLCAAAVPPIPFVCPEEDIIQTIGTESPAKKKKAKKEPGFASGTGVIRVKGQIANAIQRKSIATVLAVGTGRKLSTDALVAAIMCITQESDSGAETDHGKGGSYGLFSQTPPAWGTIAQVSDPIYSSNRFYNAYLAAKKSHSKFNLNDLVQNVQGSAFPNAYGRWQTEAEATVAAYNGTAISSSQVGGPGVEPYEFDVGVQTIGETWWAGIQRLASEVNWRCFEDEGTLYYFSEKYLFSGQPDLTVNRLTDKELISVSWDCDTGQKSQSASIKCFMTRWSAPPGSLIQLDNEGIASGRWMVDTVTTNLTNLQGDISLKRYEPATLEPTGSSSSSGGNLNGVDSTQYNVPAKVPPNVAKVYVAAKQMASKHYGYQWGGGHGTPGVPTSGSGHGTTPPAPGFDCSGSVSGVLQAGGILQGGVRTSGGFETWGAAGEGYYMTVWANSVHVWIEFRNINGDECFSTGSSHNHGPEFQPSMHSKSGFTPRHYPGS